MSKLTKRVVDAAESRAKDYVIWDDELPGFGLRVFASGKRSYVIQYRLGKRSRRFTIGLHGVWTPERARQEAKVQLGRIAQGEDPAEEKQLDSKAITVKELCDLYVADLKAGLILGKGGRPKKASTILSDTGRIDHEGPEGHHGRQDSLQRQDEEASRPCYRAWWSGYGDAHDRALRRNTDLRGRSWDHRSEPGAWCQAAEGQRPCAASDRGRISVARRNPGQGGQDREIRAIS